MVMKHKDICQLVFSTNIFLTIQLAGEAGGAWARHYSSSWYKKMGPGPETAVEEAYASYAPQ
jgi:hypothetical protein